MSSSFIDDIQGSGDHYKSGGSVINNNNNPVVEFPSLSSQSSHLPTATDEETISTKTSTNNDCDHQVSSSCDGSSCSKPSAHRENDNTTPIVEKSSPSETLDEDEMDIEIDFDNNCNPADQIIKEALEKLVVAAKNKKNKPAIESGKQSILTNTKLGGGETLEGVTAKPSPKQQQKKPVQVIINWMESYQDDEKIQLICLQALPTILEDPVSRLLAQTDGLTSIVFFDMSAFPDNPILQLHAFHTLVVLLRPAAAYEGKTASVKRRHNNHNASSIIQHGKVLGAKRKATLPDFEDNGVRVMLASLRRYSNDMYIQAIGCWALVNAALYPSLKTSLSRLGAVYTVTNAMMLHPNVEAVQYRGLFALINLVIPDDKKRDGDGSSISSHIYQIARLTIVAMKTFHSNKSILNRGCCVLRNLSLTPAFVKILAKTPGSVDILLHCRQVCPKDALVQRSARTIMVLMQRVNERQKDGNTDFESSFQLTQPHAAPSTQVASSSSTAIGDTAGEQSQSPF